MYDEVFQGFLVKMSDARARGLAADPSVEYVERDQVLSVQATQTNPPSWGLDRLDQRYTYDSTGSGVNAYVIDTGVRITHQTFGGRARNGWDFVDDDGVAQDGNGHGAHVAGTIAGSQHGVAKAANHVKPAVADMSLGGGARSSFSDFGAVVDVFVPGRDITSSWNTSAVRPWFP